MSGASGGGIGSRRLSICLNTTPRLTTSAGAGLNGGQNNAATTNSPGLTEDDQRDNGWNCNMHPSVVFLLGTLLMTSFSTAMLCSSIMTEHWEEITWSREYLTSLVGQYNNQTLLIHELQATSDLMTDNNNELGISIPNIEYINDYNKHGYNKIIHVDWLLDGGVGKVSIMPLDGASARQMQLIAFLVPMHGGIWTLCVNLSDNEIKYLNRNGFPPVRSCVNYLSNGNENHSKNHFQHRMQNLSISCALVCLIVLGCAALVGAFGVFQHQVSAVLVTGVMYFIAALFCLFTLTIIHFKRAKAREMDAAGYDENDYFHKQFNDIHELTESYSDSPLDGVVLIGITLKHHADKIHLLRRLLPARDFSRAWSLDLGWGGFLLTITTSLLWVLLSKIMMFNPINNII